MDKSPICIFSREGVSRGDSNLSSHILETHSCLHTHIAPLTLIYGAPLSFQPMQHPACSCSAGCFSAMFILRDLQTVSQHLPLTPHASTVIVICSTYTLHTVIIGLSFCNLRKEYIHDCMAESADVGTMFCEPNSLDAL